MNKWQKMLVFIALFIGVIGCIGSLGYCIYYKQYVIAVGVAVLSVFAYPTFRALFKALMQ